MKLINGRAAFTAVETGNMIGRSAGTLKNWRLLESHSELPWIPGRPVMYTAEAIENYFKFNSATSNLEPES
jgi:hypothetical protein